MSKSFTAHALHSLKSIGSVAPSSKFLVNNMLKSIDFSKPLVIVEFGAGNGAFTKSLITKVHKQSKLISFELNDDFVQELSQRLGKHQQLNLIHDSAFNFEEHLQNLGVKKVDYFVSSLPLALFNAQQKSEFLKTCSNYLQADGKFLQYQYSLNSYKKLKQNFNKVGLGFTLINVPPAFIYECTNALV